LHGAQQMHDEITGLLSEGASLERVEAEVIERCGLHQDEKSALWLYAWSLADRPVRPELEARAREALSFAGD
jgi:hypothetical protein